MISNQSSDKNNYMHKTPYSKFDREGAITDMSFKDNVKRPTDKRYSKGSLMNT